MKGDTSLKNKSITRFRLNIDSVKVKLIASFVLILLLPSLSIGGFSYYTAKNQVDQQLQSLTETNINLVSHMIYQYVQQKINDISQFAEESDQDTLQDELVRYMQNHDDVEEIVLTSGNRTYSISSLTEIEASSINEESSTYTALNDATILLTDPYTSPTTSNTVVELSKAWNDGENKVSIVYALTELQHVIEGIQIGTNGFVVVFSSSGATIVEPPWGTEPMEAVSEEGGNPPSMEQANASGLELTQQSTPPEGEDIGAQPQMTALFADDSGQIEQVSPEGDSRILIYITNSLTNWKIAGDRSPSEVTAAASPIWNNTLLVLGIFLIVGSLLILLIVRSITRPLQDLTYASSVISEGNLQQRASVRGRGEFASLAASFNRMVDSLSSVVGEVTNSANQLAASSEQLSASSGQNASATEHIVTAIDQMTEGANRQVELVEDGVTSIQHVSESIEHIVTNVQRTASSTKQVTADSTKGEVAMKDAIQQMNVIHSSVAGLGEVIHHLVHTSVEIEQFIEVISEIAEQTNLLALNAAIEAARAGDQGRGFAVVANEVRKLAEQSAKSSGQVSTLISTIRQEIECVQASMSKTSGEVNAGKQSVQAAGELFMDINQSVQLINEQVQDVTQSAERIEQETNNVIEVIQHISTVSHQTASGAQTVSAATEQQLASMEEISTSATHLTTMAVELQGLVDKFKL